MSNEFKINTVGIITKGEYKDWYVYVHDDTEGDTGGFYVFFSEERGGVFPDGYDSWVENMDELRGYFAEVDWDVKWEDQPGEW